ncbi:MAG: excinuclease ABC subunit UvrB [Clostridia bacterium]|nr:excinuclease ABC subunit UvrB [Clostridia bacterium]
MEKFQLESKYKPCGDQPQAIESLANGVLDGLKTQVLLGVTGSGKTFTMANVIEKVNKPTIVIAHNKTLAAQLCNELREFFPHNRVEYFVSYYDYYQPEAYIPRSDTYIEKELQINDEIDKLRHSATSSLSERRDVIVVCSVSCIYGLGAPLEYYNMAISLRPNMEMDRDEFIRRLVEIQYKRSDIDFIRSTFRVRGDVVEVMRADNNERGLRIEFFGDEIERISEFDLVTSRAINTLEHANIFPASHYVVNSDSMNKALDQIYNDMVAQVKHFEEKGKLIEAQRIKERVSYDLEMMREMGYCNGIENYSRYFDGRLAGQMPYTLLDFFGKDYLMFVDESHITLPQLRAMFNGDKARKTNLVEYGFRLPSAFDNRPLAFEEFNSKISQLICVSATPAEYELKLADNVAEQLIRPTGLLDPKVEVRPIDGQIDDLLSEINTVVKTGHRVLVTTLTKKMSESLTNYLKEHNVRVNYMHSEIDALERIEIIGGLRRGDFDVLVGINLLREGLDIPEVQLVAILDADKEGFLRSETSLVQTIGRAARNSEGRVIMYADTMTDSMKAAISETNRRREVQNEYNVEHNIVPKTIVKDVVNTLEITKKIDNKNEKNLTKTDIYREIDILKSRMAIASSKLDFESAIKYREAIAELKKQLRES